MKFRFINEGGHFTPKNMSDLMGLVELKKEFRSLHFHKTEGGIEGEFFCVADEKGTILGFSDTRYPEQPESPQSEAERLGIPIEAYNQSLILNDPLRNELIRERKYAEAMERYSELYRNLFL